MTQRLETAPSVDRRTACIPPGGTVGMLGGGQLGRMFSMAAAAMGYRVVVLSDHADCPAAATSERTLAGDYSDSKLLDRLAESCDVVTLEFENIPVGSVETLAHRVPVYPSADVLRVAQDRVIEKTTLARAGLPVTPFHPVDSPADAGEAIERLGLPIVLKTTREGYDGKGQWKIESTADLDPQSGVTGADREPLSFAKPLIAEAWIRYQKEVSVIVARRRCEDGSSEVAVYPMFENRHRNHILDLTTCPAELPDSVASEAARLATHAAEALDLVGLICIEFFVGESGELMINEIAPRPHNSGHLTIEACRTSQFEQQLRAVCGLPLGCTELIVPAAAMLNVMGEMWSDGPPDWRQVLRVPGARLHLYGKREAKPGRKMGHITVTGEPEDVARRIAEIRDSLGQFSD